MSTSELTPRPARAGMIATWSFAAVFALAAGFFAPVDHRFAWFAVGAGVCVFLAFAVNLATGRAHGFLVRTAAAAVGALVVMGVIAIAFFLATGFAQVGAL